MDRFIVGTGRCGSTLLSRMLSEHPSMLSIFEFFNGLDMARRFSSEPVDGNAFAALISGEQRHVTMVLSRGYEVPEITYPFGPSARYKRHDPLPWILVTALPRLTPDPDALFDETMAFASELPRQHLSLHYRQLFDWLTQRLGRKCWIERSGSSIDYLGSLHEFFPDARFLHLHRDGRETALSMREHAPYRLAISLMFGLQAVGPEGAAFGASDRESRPTEIDPVTELLESRPPVEHFGRYWTQQLVRGFGALERVEPDQYLAVGFEDVVSKPKEMLQLIADFFELGGRGDWIERAAALVRGIPPTRFGMLSGEDQGRLSEACRLGMELLGRSV